MIYLIKSYLNKIERLFRDFKKLVKFMEIIKTDNYEDIKFLNDNYVKEILILLKENFVKKRRKCAAFSFARIGPSNALLSICLTYTNQRGKKYKIPLILIIDKLNVKNYNFLL